MSDLVERVREVLPSVRRDLEDLVRIESVWACLLYTSDAADE